MTVSALSAWATAREIAAQPGIWRDWAAAFDAAAVRDWVEAQAAEEWWFSGAGTSAFIGDILVAGLEGQGGRPLRAVPSTDIVSRPQAYLAGRRPLIVNFGRSGDSAETLGVLDALSALAPQAPCLNITCNPDGALATRPLPGPSHVLRLPEACHDSGFAMTASFSTMLLSALAVFDPAGSARRLADMADDLDALLPAYADLAAAEPIPGRVVFLGAGPLGGAAREAALKVLELTAGQVAVLAETSLGFRHGPKSFVTDDTMIVLFRSADPHAARYDDDLAEELRRQFPHSRLLILGAPGEIAVSARFADVWRAPLFVALAQVLAVHWAAALGVNVDNPFAGAGTLTRVVSGVRLYDVAP